MVDFNTPFSPTDRSDTQKLIGEIRELTSVMIQMDLTDICRTFHPNTKEYIFSKQLMEPSLKLTTYSITKQTSTDTKKKIGITPCIDRITMI